MGLIKSEKQITCSQFLYRKKSDAPICVGVVDSLIYYLEWRRAHAYRMLAFSEIWHVKGLHTLKS